jgi:hypothetical protein
MSKAINLTGQKFNLLTALSIYDSKPSGIRWLCICDCGKQAVVNTLKLRIGTTKSCGCHRKICFTNKTHGLANKSRTYKTWKEMRNRCNNPNAVQYKWYGGKGIRVCELWNDYTIFLSDMGDRPEGKTLDRLNNSLGYSRSNCRWATPKEQAQNNSGCFKKEHTSNRWEKSKGVAR